MAPSTPRFSFHCDTGCKCVHARRRASTSTRPEPDQEPEPGCQCPLDLPIYRVSTRLAGRQTLKGGPWGFLWFLLQAEVTASWGSSRG